MHTEARLCYVMHLAWASERVSPIRLNGEVPWLRADVLPHNKRKRLIAGCSVIFRRGEKLPIFSFLYKYK